MLDEEAFNEGSDVGESETESRSAEEDDLESEVEFVSRGTSPFKSFDTDTTNCNKEKSEPNNGNNTSDNQIECSISCVESQIRPKKSIFGIEVHNCHYGVQVNESDLSLNLANSNDLSARVLNHNRWDHCFAINRSPSTIHSHSRHNSNRYSLPVINTNVATEFINCSTSPTDVLDDSVENLVNDSTSDTDSLASDVKLEPSNKAIQRDPISSDNNSDNCDSSSASSASHKMHIPSPTGRVSPRIIRRSISYRSHHTGSSSKSADSTSDTDDTDLDNKTESDCSNSSKVDQTCTDQSNLFSQKQYTGSYDNICLPTPHLICLAPDRCASAEPMTIARISLERKSQSLSKSSLTSNGNSRRESLCSNTSSDSTPLIVVKKLPLKVRNPYCSASESDCGMESDDEFNTTVTIRLSSANSNNSETIISCNSIRDDSSCGEHSDNETNDEVDNVWNIQLKTSIEEQESENEINKAITSIENNVTSLKENTSTLIHPRTNSLANKSKEALRDSGFSENRSESPYDNVQTNDQQESDGSSYSATESEDSNDKNLVERCQQELSAFISKCQDIDEMIGPTSPLSPQNWTKHKLEDLIEEPEDNSVVVDASHVKVHHSKPMQSTVRVHLHHDRPVQTNLFVSFFCVCKM